MSLRYRIAATIFGLEIILIAAVLWITLGHATQSVREQIASTEGVTLQLLGDLSRAALLTDEFSSLQTFIESTRRDPRVQSVVVCDALGRVVAATDAGLIGDRFPAHPVVHRHSYWRQTEIRGAAGALGGLAIEFSDYPLVRANRETLNLGASTAVAGMVAIAAVGLAMGFLLTRRLEDLAATADRVAGGELGIRVRATGKDEVARVGRAVDGMVARLAANLDELRAARDHLVQPTEAMSEGFALWDADDRLVLHNRRFLELFGAAPDRMVTGARFEDLVRTICGGALAEQGAALEARIRERVAHHRGQGGPLELALKDNRWIAISESPTPDGGMVAIYRDVTDAKLHQRQLEQGEQRLRAIMDSVIDGIVTVAEDGTVESANPAALKIFARAHGELVGRPIGALLRMADDERSARPLDLAALPRHRLLEMVGRRAGASFPIELSITRLELHRCATFILTVRDITARKAAEARARHHASHDPLTDLPNRTLFEERLATALAQSRQRAEMIAVLFLDLDRFKMINDTLGHSIGDALLVELSRRLRTEVDAPHTVARMGGDEFIFILRGLRSPREAIDPAQRLLEAIRSCFRIEGHELYITASIGIALYPRDGQLPDQLLKCADMALYRAKQRGRSGWQLYSPALDHRVYERMTPETQLQHALEQDQFEVVYRPQVALGSGRVTGVEALIRWHHPELGLVPPDDFVPLAEDSGLIEPLGLWLLRTACRQHRLWRGAALPALRLAVKLPGRQLRHPGLAERLCALLRETAMEPRRLELELTESLLMQGDDATAALLGQLSTFGIGLALADFGAGCSSFGHLKRFPIQRLKIGRSFIDELGISEAGAAITRAVIAMAHGLGVEVVAGGIERFEQLALLRHHGCDEGQGDLLGQPMAAAEVPALLHRQSLPQLQPVTALA
jgi:diguanylate cyclase (GGDEF)-like protein/PAS domain S-box-containing protein